MSWLEDIDFNVTKPGRRKLTDKDILEMIDSDRDCEKELIKIGVINRAYNEIGNKNVYGLSSMQTTLPREEYWDQIKKLIN
jgi:hypothetical protein